MAKGKCRAVLGHDSKFMGKKMGLPISVAFGDEPALPGLSKGNPVQLKSSPKAKELILLFPEISDRGWQTLSKHVTVGCSGQGSCRAN